MHEVLLVDQKVFNSMSIFLNFEKLYHENNDINHNILKFL